jgi:hypothetical protein
LSTENATRNETNILPKILKLFIICCVKTSHKKLNVGACIALLACLAKEKGGN